MKAHKNLPGFSSQRRARAISPTNSIVDRHVSQKIVGIHISGNDTAQNAPATAATRRSKHLRAMCIISITVATLKKTCITITAIAERNVNVPKMRKMRAINAG